ncbi:MAG: hypothetical protein AAFR38_14170 [Planctomycetota bacterium]
MTERSRATFVWPPGPPPPARPEETAGEVAARARPLIGGVLDAERAWLGRRDLSLEEIGLELDPPEMWCWRCASGVGPGEVDELGCATCRGGRLAWSHAVRLGAYRGVLREAVAELKYAGARRLGEQFGGVLGRLIEGEMRRRGVREPESGLLVPVPSTTLRRMRLNGGVDHTLAIARGVREAIGFEIARPLRRRPGPRQATLGVSARARNASRRFGVSPVWGRRRLRGGGPVVLLDDVRTTGATLRACARLLRGLGVERERLWVATLAVSEGGGRRAESGAKQENVEPMG